MIEYRIYNKEDLFRIRAELNHLSYPDSRTIDLVLQLLHFGCTKVIFLCDIIIYAICHQSIGFL
jgi:hypothetical protein